MRLKTRAKIIAGPLPLAPLVNLVFLLLIFFMMSSSVVFWPGTQVETRVELPQSYTHTMSAADKLVITINRSGLLFFNDNPVQWDELERLLKELVHTSRLTSDKRGGPAEPARNGNGQQKPSRSPLVVLRADRGIPYGKIVEVMSLARSLNLGVYLVTDSQGDGRRGAMRLPGGKSD
jgi:biopolymer transport protein ExbD